MNKTACYLSILTCIAFASPPSWSVTQADWTPFFKSWESGCDISNQKILLEAMTPNYEAIYEHREYSVAKVPFEEGYITLPNQYQLFIDSKLSTKFDEGKTGRLIDYLTQDSSYFDANFDVVGSYYGMPMAKIGFVGGIANGIYTPYFVLDTPLDHARQVMRSKASIRSEPCEFCDSNEYGESSTSLQLYKSQENPNMTNVICDLSN